MASIDQKTDLTAQPIYWFVLWEEAIGRGNLEAAARAQLELARLGVRVQYLPAKRKGRASHAK